MNAALVSIRHLSQTFEW